MSQSSNDASLIADLNDLLQLDHDAVQAYTVAIDAVRDARYRETLVEYRADHKRHIEELAGLVRARGGLPTEISHPTSALKLVVQAIGAAPGDVTLLLAFKAVEGQVRDKYRRFATKNYTPDVADVLKAAAADEDKHYQWVEKTLKELGAGTGTLPHGIASAIEGVHKLLADPIEAVERKIMEGVGAAVGTTRQRGGGASAPSPMDAAAAMTGMAGNPADAMASAVDAVANAASAAASNVAGAAAGVAGAAGAPVPDVAGVGLTSQAPAFITALRALEESGDIEPMVALYDTDAETSGPTDLAPHQGQEGARHFWRMYRDSFGEIRSTFTKVVEGADGTVMLEWTSEGRALTGGSVAYAGVSVVEMRNGRVRRFRTYFDTRELETRGTPQGARSASSASAGADRGVEHDVARSADLDVSTPRGTGEVAPRGISAAAASRTSSVDSPLGTSAEPLA